MVCGLHISGFVQPEASIFGQDCGSGKDRLCILYPADDWKAMTQSEMNFPNAEVVMVI